MHYQIEATLALSRQNEQCDEVPANYDACVQDFRTNKIQRTCALPFEDVESTKREPINIINV